MDIKIVGPAYPETFLDEQGVEQTRSFYSFLVDGVPSLKWLPECNVPGLPKTYYIQRTINRLMSGRSSEAFGSNPTVIDGAGRIMAMPHRAGRGVVRKIEPTVESTTVVRGGRTKTVEPKPTFRFTIDGVESKEEFTTEQIAKTACAVAAFMTRGKLGAIPAALEKLKAEFPGKDCKVWACPKDHEVKASVDGKLVAIAWVDVGDRKAVERFKELVDV